MPSTSVQVDPRDVAAIEALEPMALALMNAAEAAFPALLRLVEAEYPGATALLDSLGGGLAAKKIAKGDGADLSTLVEDLDEFRVAHGDRAALDYYRMCVKDGTSLPAACAELFDRYGAEKALVHVDALRHFAVAQAVDKLPFIRLPAPPKVRVVRSK